jgi:hypothetical protein
MLSGFSGRIGPTVAANAAVDHDMADMNTLRRQLTRHALRQSAQRKLAHRKRSRLRIALYAGGSAGENDWPWVWGNMRFAAS